MSKCYFLFLRLQLFLAFFFEVFRKETQKAEEKEKDKEKEKQKAEEKEKDKEKEKEKNKENVLPTRNTALATSQCHGFKGPSQAHQSSQSRFMHHYTQMAPQLMTPELQQNLVAQYEYYSGLPQQQSFQTQQYGFQ